MQIMRTFYIPDRSVDTFVTQVLNQPSCRTTTIKAAGGSNKVDNMVLTA